MKRPHVLGTLAAVGIASLLISFGSATAQLRQAPPVQSWEYKIVHSASEPEFNALGDKGWELCTAVGPYETNTVPVTFVFKRPK